MPPRGGVPRGRAALPSPLPRVPGPQLTWGTRKARHPAPSRETPEVRDGTPSPTAPQFMFVLSRLKELKRGADTLGPAHLGPDTFPEPPPQPCSPMCTLSHTVSHLRTHTCVNAGPQTHTPHTHTHTHTHAYTIFAFIPTLFHTHSHLPP